MNRTRSAIHVFHSQLIGSRAVALDGVLSSFRKRLSKARDMQVWIRWLNSDAVVRQCAGEPEWSQFLGRERKRNASLLLELKRTIGSPGFGRLMNAFNALIGAEIPDLMESRADASVRRLLAAELDRHCRRLWAARRVSSSMAPADLHVLRKRCRKARYVAEFAAPVFGRPARILLRTLRNVTSSLGDMHDMDVQLAEGIAKRPLALGPCLTRARARAARRFDRAWRVFCSRDSQGQVKTVIEHACASESRERGSETGEIHAGVFVKEGDR